MEPGAVFGFVAGACLEEKGGLGNGRLARELSMHITYRF